MAALTFNDVKYVSALEQNNRLYDLHNHTTDRSYIPEAIQTLIEIREDNDTLMKEIITKGIDNSDHLVGEFTSLNTKIESTLQEYQKMLTDPLPVPGGPPPGWTLKNTINAAEPQRFNQPVRVGPPGAAAEPPRKNPHVPVGPPPGWRPNNELGAAAEPQHEDAPQRSNQHEDAPQRSNQPVPVGPPPRTTVEDIGGKRKTRRKRKRTRRRKQIRTRRR